ncbi:MAG: hypothetical protein BWY32_01075 [bacterium ADurb.Bin243]|nr:MAG: hypothetical protein BWY32_01075 [bacterium ADurb.Bin243]
MKVKQIAQAGMFTALVAVVTKIAQVPTPLTQGYINLGDIFVIFGGFYTGRGCGFFIGGVGSALADILSGYPFYYVTFLVKGLEGYAAGLPPFAYKPDLPKAANGLRLLYGALIAAAIMVCGYFLLHITVFNSVKAFSSLGPNVVQGAAGVAGALLVFNKTVNKKIY